MAAANQLQITITANVQNAVNGVQNTTNALNTIPPAANNANTALNTLSRSSGRAGDVLSNFGRVAQDAAFGPAAIANNLNPLVESFQRLRSETGSTGGALRALGSNLIGSGGIGFAISAITAALSFASVGLAMWSRKSKEAKEKTDEFAKSLDSARAGAMSTGVQLQSFVDIARDSTRPLAERNEALKQANKIMGEHGEKLTLVNINTKAVTDEVNLFTQALINQALAAKFADKIADLTIAQSAATKKYTEDLKAYKKAVEDAKKAESVTVSGGTGGVGGLGNVSAAAMTAAALGRAEDAAEAYKDTTKELNETYAEFNSLQSKAVQGFGALGTKQKESHKNFEQIIEDIGKFEALGRGFTALGGFTDFILNARIEFRKNAFNDLKKDAQDLVNLVNNGPAAPKLELRMDTNIKGMLDQIKAAQDAAIKLQADFNNQVNELAKQMAVGVFTAIGEGIGSMLAGQKSPFAGIISVLADGLKALGKLYIQIGTEMLIAQKAIKAIASNPYLTIAAGIALTALGQVAQSLLTKQTKLAEGGIVSGPTSAMIGEAGQSEVVLPLSRLSGMLSNNRGALVLETRVSGQDLLLVQARASASRGRTFG